MRTTLNIDEDVLASARYLAKKSHKSVGQIVSELTRLGLKAPIAIDRCTAGWTATRDPVGKKLEKLGLMPFKAVHGKPVTDAIVDLIRESESV